MWSKIKEFFKRFWWLALVPLVLFVLHTVFRRETPELDRLIKDKKKEIDSLNKQVNKDSKEAEEAEASLKDSVAKAESTLSDSLKDSKKRDEKAEEFFK